MCFSRPKLLPPTRSPLSINHQTIFHHIANSANFSKEAGHRISIRIIRTKLRRSGDLTHLVWSDTQPTLKVDLSRMRWWKLQNKSSSQQRRCSHLCGKVTQSWNLLCCPTELAVLRLPSFRLRQLALHHGAINRCTRLGNLTETSPKKECQWFRQDYQWWWTGTSQLAYYKAWSFLMRLGQKKVYVKRCQCWVQVISL